jgi:hypothetical protein
MDPDLLVHLHSLWVSVCAASTKENQFSKSTYVLRRQIGTQEAKQ